MKTRTLSASTNKPPQQAPRPNKVNLNSRLNHSHNHYLLKTMSRFTDFGDAGSYTGEMSNGKRQGQGKMVYDSGNTYEGGFKNNLFDGLGVYTWSDGDSQQSNWSASKRHGPSIFRASNGEVEYTMYTHDEAGHGVTWSPCRTKAHRLAGGKKGEEISLGMAEKIAKEFGFSVPEVSEKKVRKMPKSGLMTRMFASSYVDGAGNVRFKDYGEWGTYVGDLDSDMKRQGRGKISFDDGGSYDGSFVNNKYDGEGTYRWADGEEYQGEWKDGERNGKGVFRAKDGSVEYSFFDMGTPVGEGVTWSADRKTVHRTRDGKQMMEMLPEEAEVFAGDKFGLPVPEVCEVKEAAPVVAKKSVGLFARLFNSGPRFDENGRPMFKDNGDWGTWSGEVDADNKRMGGGTMTYESGAIYTGNFVDDVYDDDSGEGKYMWNDGEYYQGQWKKGERNGQGKYCSVDGSVEYSMYENGLAVGQGLKWSANRKTAHRLVDGKPTTEISLGVAEKEAKEKFGLSVPEVMVVQPPDIKSDAKPTQPGLFQRIFKGAPPLDEDGNPMYRDNSDWGSYVGERDANGHRSGKGKITYQSGSVYEGGFVNNKYEGEGTYSWGDGDEYSGEWKNGERNGKGSFKHADGTVEISLFSNGEAKGEGIQWSPDRKSAWKMLNGEKRIEMLPEEAQQFALEKFGVEVPAAVTAVTPKGPIDPPSEVAAASKETPGLFSRLWNKYDADGNLMYKDNGDWGSWKGELDSDGKRTGKGTMTYEAGAVYDGYFVNDKYEGLGTYKWEDGDVYEGEWKDGERHGKGVFRSGDGITEYSMYVAGAPSGEGVSWEPDRKSAYRLKDGERSLEMTVEEAEKFSKEKFDLPIPEQYEPTKPPANGGGGGFFGFFSSGQQSTPSETPPPQNNTSSQTSQSLVETWLKAELPNLNSSDLQTYSKQLLDDGFDSVEMLNHLEVGDLGFMKKAHQRVLVEKLKGKK